MIRILATKLTAILLISIVGCSKTHRIEIEEGRAAYYENDEVIAQLNEVWEKNYLTAKGEAAVPPGYHSGDRVGRERSHTVHRERWPP